MWFQQVKRLEGNDYLFARIKNREVEEKDLSDVGSGAKAPASRGGKDQGNREDDSGGDRSSRGDHAVGENEASERGSNRREEDVGEGEKDREGDADEEDENGGDQ